MLNEYSLSLVRTPLTVDEVIKLLHVSRRDVTQHVASALIDASVVSAVQLALAEQSAQVKRWEFSRIIFENCEFAQIYFPLAFYQCVFIDCIFTDINPVDSFPIALEDNSFKGCHFTNCTSKGFVRLNSFSHCTFSDIVHKHDSIQDNCMQYCKFKTDEQSVSFDTTRWWNNSNIQPIVMQYAIPSPLACPSEGAFIGWKVADRIDIAIPVLIKLMIPASAKRTSSYGAECRCDKAKVLKIMSLDGSENYDAACSIHDHTFIYKIDEYVEEPQYDSNRSNICSSGIHFFIDKQAAIDYYIT